MSFVISLDLAYEFAVHAPLDEVYALVADVPRSTSYFPKVQRLVPLGRGVYRWEMEPVGTAEVNIKTIYASRYRCSKAKGQVIWTPVPGVGNAQVSGSWALKKLKAGTQLTLNISGSQELALPALLKAVVVPVVQAEFEKLVEQYIDALIDEWGGEL